MVLILPSTAGFSAFSVLEINERSTSVDVAEDDEEAVISMEKRDSIPIGQKEEELVDITNNLDFEVETEVQLSDDINWSPAEEQEPVLELDSGSGEVYNVDTRQVSNADEVGEYVLVTEKGSFVLTKEREVQLEPPRFNPRDGNDIIDEINENGTSGGECLDDINDCRPEEETPQQITLDEDVDGFVYLESSSDPPDFETELNVEVSEIGGSLVINVAGDVDVTINEGSVQGDVVIKTFEPGRGPNDGNVNLNLINGGTIEGDVEIDAVGNVNLNIEDGQVLGNINDSASIDLQNPEQ